MVLFFVWTELSTSQLEGAHRVAPGGAVASVPDPLPDTFKSLSLTRKEMDSGPHTKWPIIWTHQMDSGTFGQRGERERGVAK